MTGLSGLFDPGRIVVVGATDRPGSVGRALMENLSTFDGPVVPVNPDRESVCGIPAYRTIDAVPAVGAEDLAIIGVPAPEVVTVVQQVAEAGIRDVVVISAGFSESGSAGYSRERELIEIAESYGVNLIGPNCVGVISTRTGMNATFLHETAQPGPISLISQSGAVIAAILGWASQHEIGFDTIVSLGNEAVLDESDVIRELGADANTEVILAYLEDIDDGQRFIRAARKIGLSTPIVVLKAGRTDAGAEAAASHTGSIAGSEEAYQAGLQQAGVIRATEIQDVFDFARVFSGPPPLEGDNIAVVTNGGGPGVLAADAIGDSRLNMATFPDDIRSQLTDVLPHTAAVANPLDIIGDADVERFRRSLDIVLGADAVDGVILLSVPTALFDFVDLADVIGSIQRSHDKPVVTCLMGGDGADRAARKLDTDGIPNYFDPARAVRSLDALATYRDARTRESEQPKTFTVDRERARTVLGQAAARDATYLSVEAMELLDAYGIPIPSGGLARSAEEAEELAQEIGDPVVMKIASPDILHKSDIGGVEIGVPLAAVEDTYYEFLDRAANHAPNTDVLGVYVEELVDWDDETETIVGVRRDAQFGPVVMFGLGGIFVQVFEDTSFRIAPVSEREARTMTEEVTTAPLLRGARGRTPADIDAVVETIQRVSQLVIEVPAIRELDINPLIVAPDGVCAVDLQVTVDPTAL